MLLLSSTVVTTTACSVRAIASFISALTYEVLSKINENFQIRGEVFCIWSWFPFYELVALPVPQINFHTVSKLSLFWASDRIKKNICVNFSSEISNQRICLKKKRNSVQIKIVNIIWVISSISKINNHNKYELMF